MSLPQWADEDFSNELSVLRSRGEGQTLEYMESFPQQARDLGKEIAAFATSNGGLILLGVSDSGDLVGLSEAKTLEGRDTFLRRIEGVSHGTIKPAITPTVSFAVEDESIVVVISVPKGSQPIYYCNNQPYIRHVTQSRPSEAHEVIELIQKWSAVSGQGLPQSNSLSNLVNRIGPVIIDVIIYGNELENRIVKPWLQMLRTQFQQSATELRELALEAVASHEHLDAELRALAEALDNVASISLTAESSSKFILGVHQVVQSAEAFKHSRIASLVAQKPIDNAKRVLLTTQRRLADLTVRAETTVNWNVNEITAEASGIGMDLLRLSHLGVDRLQAGLSRKLREIGSDLHLMETAPLFLDGGRSVQAMVNRIRSASQLLSEAAAGINES